MRHQDLTINHRMESWVFANAAARNTAGTYVSGDIGRISYQTDTKQYWRLMSTTPTWSNVSAGTTTLQTTAVDPTGTANTTGVMSGLAGIITPVASGKIFVTICGTMSNNNGAGGCAVVIRYGTGTAPANGVALTGTPLGGVAIRTAMTASTTVPFSLNAVITGLTPGTAYWLDLHQQAIGAGAASLSNVAVCAFELP
jgi:hypothetical protein